MKKLSLFALAAAGLLLGACSDKDAVNPKLDALKEALKGSDINAIKNAKDELQKAVDAGDVEEMKTKMEALTNAFYPISTRIYQEAQAAQGGAGAQGFDPSNMGGMGFDPNMGGAGFNPGNMGGSSASDDGTVDADYEVVDD